MPLFLTCLQAGIWVEANRNLRQALRLRKGKEMNRNWEERMRIGMGRRKAILAKQAVEPPTKKKPFIIPVTQKTQVLTRKLVKGTRSASRGWKALLNTLMGSAQHKHYLLCFGR